MNRIHGDQCVTRTSFVVEPCFLPGLIVKIILVQLLTRALPVTHWVKLGLRNADDRKIGDRKIEDTMHCLSVIHFPVTHFSVGLAQFPQSVIWVEKAVWNSPASDSSRVY